MSVAPARLWAEGPEGSAGGSSPPSRRFGPVGVPSPAERRRNARWTLLVADDEQAVRETLAEILAVTGYTVRQAADGDEALDGAAEDVDLLILDLHMPGSDGLEVLARLPAEGPLVILYSAFALYRPEQLDQMGLRGRVFRVLLKPAPPREILRAVGDAIAELERRS